MIFLFSTLKNYSKQSKNNEILNHFTGDMLPAARVYYNSNRVAVLDLLPYLADILQPNLRSVALKLFSKSEKDKLDNLIQIMISFNLIYRQEKAAEGQYCFVLEP